MSLRDAWEKNAGDWINWARTPEHDIYYWRLNRPNFLELIPPPGRLTVDIGCGEGRLGRDLRDRGHFVVNIDSSPTLARAAAEAEEPHRVVVADAAWLPLPPDVADLVISFMSLQDIDDLDRSVSEASRILVSGGRYCIANLHPLSSSGTFEVKERGAHFTISDSYFEHRRYSIPVERAGLPMTFVSDHRPLEAYFSALEKAGFLVEALRELRPDDQLVEDAPSIGRWTQVPIFIHIRALKR